MMTIYSWLCQAALLNATNHLLQSDTERFPLTRKEIIQKRRKQINVQTEVNDVCVETIPL